MGYLKNTIHGVGWIGGFRGLSRIIAFVRIAILARILTPSDFGALGIATLVLAFVEIFTETGVNTVLIQNKKRIDQYLDTAFVISIIRGFFISLLVLVSAPLVSRFFNSPQSLYLILLISVVPLIRGFINPAIVNFQKELEFNKEFYFRTTIFFVDALVAVVATYILKSPTGIIFGFIFGAILETILSFRLPLPKPKFKFREDYVKEIISGGKWVTGIGIFQYLFRQGDDIVVGRILGQYSLGLYQATYKISTLPISEVADVAGKVTFPVFSKMDTSRVPKAFIKSFAGVSLVALLLGGIIYVFPEQIVRILLGSQWLEGVEILKLLAIFGILKSVVVSFDSLFLATKSQKYITVTSGFSTLLMFMTIFPLISSYGLLGAGYSIIISTLLTIPLVIFFAVKVIKR